MSSKAQGTQLTVYRGFKDTGKHVWSPFVVKLEARLRFAGVKYATDAGSPRTAPRGKIPYIECSNPNTDSEPKRTQLSDSTLIAKTLTGWNVLPDINAHLPPSDRAQDLALRALLEDKLVFYHAYERWTRNYYTMRDHVLWFIPYPIRVIVGLIIYRNTVAILHGQGTGRFSNDEIAEFRREIWGSINDRLTVASRVKSSRSNGDKKEPFWVLGGHDPTEADATLFGFIVSVLLCTAAPESQEVVKGFPVILEYASRIHDAYFPDYEKWTL